MLPVSTVLGKFILVDSKRHLRFLEEHPEV